MPSKDEHVTQAEHNRNFWSSYDLTSTDFVDWVVTGLFYECIHWIEAYLGIQGEHSGGHPDRLKAIKRHSADIGTIRTDYELLKTESENARYSCYKHQAADIENDILPVLEAIKAKIQVLI